MGAISAPSASGQEKKNNNAQPIHKPKRSVRLAFVIVGSIILFVVIALGLGLGLGLGLKHKHIAVPATAESSVPSATSSPLGSQTLPSWRRNVSEYDLDMNTWNINAEPTTRIYNFTLSEIVGAPDGVARKMFVINGKFPGPLIRANRGDRILVNVTNNLSEPTSMHWHGMFQNGTNWMDGTAGITQCPIPSGRSFLYNFTIENQYGTYWYHSHYSTQYLDGVFGPLIIHAPEEAHFRELYDHDQVVILQDYYHNVTSTLIPDYLASGNENNEPVPDNGLMQGTNYFNCSSLGSDSGYTCYDNSTRAVIPVQKNQRHRLRLINTGGFAEFQFSVDNHTLSVIEADATMVEPLDVHRLSIAVAQRYSVVLTANQEVANYWIRADMNTFCFATNNPVLDSSVKGILTYTNTDTDPKDEISTDWSDARNVVCQDLNSTLLTPAVSQSAPPANVLYSLQFSFLIRDYALDRAYVNGTTSWTMSDIPTLNQVVSGLNAGNQTYNVSGVTPSYNLSNQYIIGIPETQVVDILISNFDDGAHPFHLHGHEFWVLATSPEMYFPWSIYGSLNTTNPVRRDTVTVDAYGWALIRFRSDNPGMWAFHCHIAWHLEAGLLMQFQTRNDLMKNWTLPEDVLGLCKA